MGYLTMKVKSKIRKHIKQWDPVPFLSYLLFIQVSLMRHDTYVELKHDQDDQGLEESKEEETPLQQILKVVEKNSK